MLPFVSAMVQPTSLGVRQRCTSIRAFRFQDICRIPTGRPSSAPSREAAAIQQEKHRRPAGAWAFLKFRTCEMPLRPCLERCQPDRAA